MPLRLFGFCSGPPRATLPVTPRVGSRHCTRGEAAGSWRASHAPKCKVRTCSCAHDPVHGKRRAGKTHHMHGRHGGGAGDERKGMVSQAVRDLFARTRLLGGYVRALRRSRPSVSLVPMVSRMVSPRHFLVLSRCPPYLTQPPPQPSQRRRCLPFFVYGPGHEPTRPTTPSWCGRNTHFCTHSRCATPCTTPCATGTPSL